MLLLLTDFSITCLQLHHSTVCLLVFPASIIYDIAYSLGVLVFIVSSSIHVCDTPHVQPQPTPTVATLAPMQLISHQRAIVRHSVLSWTVFQQVSPARKHSVFLNSSKSFGSCLNRRSCHEAVILTYVQVAKQVTFFYPATQAGLTKQWWWCTILILFILLQWLVLPTMRFRADCKQEHLPTKGIGQYNVLYDMVQYSFVLYCTALYCLVLFRCWAKHVRRLYAIFARLQVARVLSMQQLFSFLVV